MSSHLVWHSLIFVIPLVVAFALVVGAAFGVVAVAVDVDVELDADVDLDADADVDADGDPQGGTAASGLLQLLGVGRVPLAVVLTSLLAVFGGAGLALRYALAPLVGTGTAPTLVAAAVAAALSFFGSAAIARLVARYLPTMETYANSGGDLVGAIGNVQVSVSGDFGVAHVTDGRGTFHQIRCRTDEDAICRGSRVIVTDYDADRGVHTVARSPL